MEPNFWFGKDNVVLPNPAGGGTLLSPAELARILTDPANGLFEAKVETPVAVAVAPVETDSHPNVPIGNLTHVKSKTLRQKKVDVDAIRLQLPNEGLNYEFMLDEVGNLWAVQIDRGVSDPSPRYCGTYSAFDTNSSSGRSDAQESVRTKGSSFRGGSKKTRDAWYGYNDKEFQNWWHRSGKEEFGRGDIENAAEAKEAYDYWISIGSPQVK